jgi:hypothetical protein
MLLMRPTAQNMALELYVHQKMAPLVMMYPKKVSMGMTIPTSDVMTNGSKQYPRTDAERAKVRVEAKWDGRPEWSWTAALSAGETGGDMRDKMTWREVLPSRARP